MGEEAAGENMELGPAEVVWALVGMELWAEGAKGKR